jgi:hypothetical protein
MTINEYFMNPEKPAPGSPVGTIMLRILAKDPRVEYEEARSQAQRLLQKAARKNVYRVPRVLGPDERARLKARMETRTKSEPADDIQPFLTFSETHGAVI